MHESIFFGFIIVAKIRHQVQQFSALDQNGKLVKSSSFAGRNYQ